MAKLSKIFRLSEEAVAILDSKDNATKFVEYLILRQSEHISKGEALILDRLDELMFNRLPDDGESHPIHPDIKNNSGASPPPDIAKRYKSAVAEAKEWVSAGEKKVQITPPCCFLPKKCDHDVWVMDLGHWQNSKTGVIKTEGVE